jgi:predicted nucleic acid-binding protein
MATWADTGFAIIRRTLKKYRSLEPDFTDALLVTMADLSNIRRILTVDIRDFSVYRFSDGGMFERLWI